MKWLVASLAGTCSTSMFHHIYPSSHLSFVVFLVTHEILFCLVLVIWVWLGNSVIRILGSDKMASLNLFSTMSFDRHALLGVLAVDYLQSSPIAMSGLAELYTFSQ